MQWCSRRFWCSNKTGPERERENSELLQRIRGFLPFSSFMTEVNHSGPFFFPPSLFCIPFHHSDEEFFKSRRERERENPHLHHHHHHQNPSIQAAWMDGWMNPVRRSKKKWEREYSAKVIEPARRKSAPRDDSAMADEHLGANFLITIHNSFHLAATAVLLVSGIILKPFFVFFMNSFSLFSFCKTTAEYIRYHRRRRRRCCLLVVCFA